MRTIFKIFAIASFLFLGIGNIQAQNDRNLDNYREPDKDGINVFEAPKDTISTFDGLKVRIGGAFALQFQALDNENANLEGCQIQTLTFLLPISI